MKIPESPFASQRAAMAALLLLCLLCPLAAARAGSVEDLDRMNGLPEAKLGVSVAAFKDVKLVEDVGRWVTYQPTAEKLSYAGFEVAGVKYNFFKGKLYSINVNVDGRRSTLGILKTLERDFGTTHSLERHHVADSDTDLMIREWTGSKVYLLYKSAENGRGAEMILLDKPTWDLLQVPREQRAAESRALMGGSFINGDF